MSEGWAREEAGRDLIDRAKHDPAAFGELYDLYADRIYAFCHTRSAGQEEAEDLMAQTFERALRSIGRYEHRGIPFSAWLFRIAANLAVDRARRTPTLVHFEDYTALDAMEERSEQTEADTWVERWEQADWLQAHLATLPIDQQRAVRLRYYEDRALEDIAAVMGRSNGAVRQLLHRAVHALRLQMQGEEPSGA